MRLMLKLPIPSKNAIEGATVTLHSTPRTATTDKQGIAHFTDIEAGNHQVIIAYDNFKGEQSINLSGNEVKEFNLNIEVKTTKPSS